MTVNINELRLLTLQNFILDEHDKRFQADYSKTIRRGKSNQTLSPLYLARAFQENSFQVLSTISISNVFGMGWELDTLVVVPYLSVTI